MVSRGNKRASIYGDYVVEQIAAISRAGGARHTIKTLARALGLPVTHNLRRRLFTCQKMGLLRIDYEGTPSGGICYSYIIRPPDAPYNGNFDIPF